MFFIGIAIAVAIGLVVLLISDAGTAIGVTQDQVMHALPLGIILIVIAGGMFARRYRASELVGGVVLWVGIFALSLVGYSYREELAGVATRVFGEVVPGAAEVDAKTGAVTFRSGADGHFSINANINGSLIHTVFDTGASAVVLSDVDARRAGIDTKTLVYNVAVSTANGTGRAAKVVLDKIEVGGIVRRNIQAFVTDKGALETSLLGMTFLKTLSGYAVAGRSLELTD
ncbi:retropepsin-like aspartic protease family protein [Devosia sp.]|uniref:retropepsin-like aspartic protease family protein n=1 Tax=Devosia sp. TaxID=1871048 RepID=UPI003BAB816B